MPSGLGCTEQATHLNVVTVCDLLLMLGIVDELIETKPKFGKHMQTCITYCI